MATDARSMKRRGGGIVGYNVQTAVDAKNHCQRPGSRRPTHGIEKALSRESLSHA